MAIGLATLAVAALGCATRSGYGADLVYAGTGSAQTTGEAAADLGHQEVDVRICVGVRRTADEEPQSFAAIVVGGGCVIPAEQSGRNVVGDPGTMCSLRVDGRVHWLRITDAMVTFAQHAVWTRFGPVTILDRSVLQARIGGDEGDGVGGVRHSLYLFEGPLTRSGDAYDWCEAMLPKPDPPAPAVQTETTAEANSF